MSIQALVPSLEIWQYLTIGLLSFLLSISWSLPFIVFKIFRWSLFVITEKTDVLYFQKKLKISGTHEGDRYSYGIFYGKWYVGNAFSYSCDDYFPTLYLLCSKKFYKNLIDSKNKPHDYDEQNCERNDEQNDEQNNDKTDNTDDNSETEEKDNEKTDILKSKKKYMELSITERQGSTYADLHYRNREIYLIQTTPRLKQQQIIDSIKSIYGKKNHAVVLISGPSGAGKSICGMLLAKELNATYCATYNPCEPGDNFSYLYTSTNPEKDKPLVILLDEIDININNIHNNLIERDRKHPIQITNKISWNRFFDDIDNGIYPSVVFVMTSNQNKEYFDSLDSAYFRNGRIDGIYELAKQD